MLRDARVKNFNLLHSWSVCSNTENVHWRITQLFPFLGHIHANIGIAELAIHCILSNTFWADCSVISVPPDTFIENADAYF